MHLLVTHRCPKCGFQKEYAYIPIAFPFEHCPGVLTVETSRRYETLTIDDNGKLAVESEFYAERFKKLLAEKVMPRSPEAWRRIPSPPPGLLGAYAASDAKYTMRVWEEQKRIEQEYLARQRKRLIMLIACVVAIIAIFFLVFGFKAATVLAVVMMSIPAGWAVCDFWRSVR